MQRQGIPPIGFEMAYLLWLFQNFIASPHQEQSILESQRE